MQLALLLLLEQAHAMKLPIIDPKRVDAELAADLDVLKSLKDNGDVPDVRRPVDVRFVGPAAEVADLQSQVAALGWRVIQRVRLDDGDEALDVQRDQATNPAAIRQLTVAALEIESRYGVRYDGWGTIATKQ